MAGAAAAAAQLRKVREKAKNTDLAEKAGAVNDFQRFVLSRVYYLKTYICVFKTKLCMSLEF